MRTHRPSALRVARKYKERRQGQQSTEEPPRPLAGGELRKASHRAVKGCLGNDLFRNDGGTGTRIGAFKSLIDFKAKGS